MKVSERTALIRAMLHETFPAAFAGKGQPKTPLAVGIFKEIARALPEINPKHLGWALNDYTSGPTYLRACVEGADRIGLDGRPSGLVSAKAAEYAESRLRVFEHKKRERHARGRRDTREPCAEEVAAP